MKLKAKKQYKSLFTKTLAIFLLGLLVFSFVLPQKAFASPEVYDVREFSFRVNSVGDIAADDGNALIKVATDGTNLPVPLSFNLTLFEPRLVAGDDAIDTSDRLTGGGSAGIDGFYLWIVPPSIMSQYCDSGVSGNFGAYLDCSHADNFVRTPNIDSLTPGRPEVISTSITSAVVQQYLSETGVEPSAEGTTIRLYVVPGIDINGADPIYAGSQSKTLYLRVFDTEENLNNSDDEVITTPPGTGENEGSGTFANWLGGTLISIVNTVIGAVAAIIRWIVWIIGSWIIIPVLETTLTLTANDIASGPVLAGWTYVRDVANMFFILAMIVIGLATILRIESYSYRKLTVNLILMALLVNFSLVFGQAIIQIADVAQFSFLPTEVQIEGQTDGVSGVKYLYQNLSTVHVASITDGLRGFSGDSSTALATTFSIIFQLMLELGIILTFGALAAFMVIRTVALWILLVISPFAYVFTIIPSTAGMAKQWWSNFFKYAFFAAIVAFFLRLTLVFYVKGLGATGAWTVFSDDSVNTAEAPGDLIEYIQGLGGSVDGQITFGDAISLGIVYVMIIAFMWAGMIFANKISIFGSSAIVGLAEKGMASPFALGAFGVRRGMGYVGRWWNDKTTGLLDYGEGKNPPGIIKKAAFAVLNPVAFARGWEQRAQELSEISSSGAAARGRMVAEQALTWGKLKIPYGQFSDRADENKFMDDYTGMRKESLMRAALDISDMGGEEGKLRRRALIKAAATQGYLDDILRMRPFAEKYGDADGTFYSDEVLNRFLYGYLGDDEQSMRFMAEDMEDLGKNTGHFEYLGHAYYDPDQKKFVRGMEVIGEEDGMGGRKVEALKNTWQAGYASGELSKVSGRNRLSIAPHNFVALRAPVEERDGKLVYSQTGDEISEGIMFGTQDGEVSTFYKAMFSKISPGDLRELHHSQDRTKQWILGTEFDSRTGEIILNNKEEYEKIKKEWQENPEYLRGLYGAFHGMSYADAQKNLPGIKVAYYETQPDGSVKKIRTPGVGTASAVSQPVEGIVTKSFEDEFKVELAAFDDANKGLKEKLVRHVSNHIRDIYSGRIDRQHLEAELDKVIRKANISDADLPIDKDGNKVTAKVLADRAFGNVEQNISATYSPAHALEKIDARLGKITVKDEKGNDVRLRLETREAQLITPALNKAFVSAWSKISKDSNIDMDSPEAGKILRDEFRDAIKNLKDPNGKIKGEDVLKKIQKVKGMSWLVWQVRPSRPEGNGPTNPEEESSSQQNS